MAITHRIDDKRRLVWMTLDGNTTGAEASAFIVEMNEARSELVDYDFVHDLRNASGDANNNDVDRVATSFAARPSVQTHTVFITHDPAFGVWARAMDFQFPNRQHHVVASPQGAEALLERLRSGVSPARSPR